MPGEEGSCVRSLLQVDRTCALWNDRSQESLCLSAFWGHGEDHQRYDAHPRVGVCTPVTSRQRQHQRHPCEEGDGAREEGLLLLLLPRCWSQGHQRPPPGRSFSGEEPGAEVCGEARPYLRVHIRYENPPFSYVSCHCIKDRNHHRYWLWPHTTPQHEWRHQK